MKQRVKWVIYLTYVVCLIFSIISKANTTPSYSVESLIQRHIEASGGYAMLMNIQSISREGKIDFYNQNNARARYGYHTDIVYPNKLHEKIAGQIILHERGTDGISYWVWTGQQYQLTEDPLIEMSMRETAQRANREMLWVEKDMNNYTWTQAPSWAPSSSQCIQQIETSDSMKRMYCFDNRTGLLNALGTDEEYRLLSNWNSVDNIKIPFKLTHYQKGHMIYEVNLDHADLNQEIPDTQFSKPE